MMPADKVTLSEQRRALRQQLLAQRGQIARQLASQSEAGSYPRSMTMRLLTGKSALGSRLVMSATTMLGIRAVKSLAVSLLMSKFSKRKHG